VKYRLYIVGSAAVTLVVFCFWLGWNKGSFLFNEFTLTTNSKNMEQMIGNSWDKYSLPAKQVPDMVMITLVSDGIINQKPIDIKTRQGEKLATSILSINGSYFDSNKRKQHVIVPLLIKLSNGEIFHPAFTIPITWQGEELKQKIISRADLFGTVKGSIIKIGLIVPGNTRKIDKSQLTGDIHEEVYPIVVKYNASWKDELEKFIKTGDSDLGIIFSFSLSLSNTQEITNEN
jgi:hypothetical protein